MTGFAQRFIQEGLQQRIQQVIQQGMERGLEAERRLLVLVAKMRFGAATATRSAPLLERIIDPEALEALGEALPVSTDAANWLAAVAQAAETGT